jgi:hypothetical protein
MFLILIITKFIFIKITIILISISESIQIYCLKKEIIIWFEFKIILILNLTTFYEPIDCLLLIN